MDAAGVARQVAAATLVWPDETIGDLVYRFIALCVSGLLALVVIVPLVRRAREIESVALAVAAGNLDARARPGGPRELASLSRAIHTMADRVAALLRSRQVMLRAVAHEVAHLLEHNHSPDFWRIVKGLMPNYRVQQAWLNKNGGTLAI